MSRRTVPLVALLVIALSGCFKINLDIEVTDDGSGTVAGLVALDTDAAAKLSSIFEEEGEPAPTREELCQEFLADTDVPEGSTTEPYDEGKFCGIRFTQEFAAGELDAVLSDSLAGDGTGDFDIQRDGDGWRFDATFDDTATGDADFFPEELFSDAEFIVRIKLPGRQVEHNADSIDKQGAMIWNVNLFNPGEPLMARTEPGTPITGSGGDGSGSSAALIIVLVLVAAALGVGAWWYVKKRSATPTTPTDPGPTDPGPTDPGQPFDPAAVPSAATAVPQAATTGVPPVAAGPPTMPQPGPHSPPPAAAPPAAPAPPPAPSPPPPPPAAPEQPPPPPA